MKVIVLLIFIIALIGFLPPIGALFALGVLGVWAGYWPLLIYAAVLSFELEWFYIVGLYVGLYAFVKLLYVVLYPIVDSRKRIKIKPLL